MLLTIYFLSNVFTEFRFPITCSFSELSLKIGLAQISQHPVSMTDLYTQAYCQFISKPAQQHTTMDVNSWPLSSATMHRRPFSCHCHHLTLTKTKIESTIHTDGADALFTHTDFMTTSFNYCQTDYRYTSQSYCVLT